MEFLYFETVSNLYFYVTTILYMEYNRIIFQTNFNLMYMLLKVILGIWIVYIAFKEQDDCIYIYVAEEEG